MGLVIKFIGEKEACGPLWADRYEIGPEGGTIGRSEDNDVCLPDDSHHVSSHHATIDYHGGRYYLMDVSMNGVYLNDSVEPVGSGRPQLLFDGDKLRIGEYLLGIEIEDYLDALPLTGCAGRRPPEPAGGSRDPLLTERVLLDHEKTMRVNDFPPRYYGESLTDTVILPDSAMQQVTSRIPSDEAPLERSKVARIHPVTPGSDGAREDVDATSGQSFESAEPSAELQAFLDGIGLRAADLGGAESKHVMRQAGLALRELVEGSMSIMRSHAAVKNMFELEDETTSPRDYNPLRSAGSPNYALRDLLTNRRAADAPATTSIRDVCGELKRHEIAMFCALRDSFRKFNHEIHPQRFTTATNGRRGPFFGAMAKAKAWESYEGRFEALNERGAGQLPRFLGQQFSSAYEMHKKRLQKEKAVDQSADKPKSAGART